MFVFLVLYLSFFVCRNGCITALASAGAKPCGARRAERLGRSGGRGQRRARWRYSSPRQGWSGPGLHFFFAVAFGTTSLVVLPTRDRARRDLLPAQLLPSIVNLDPAVLPLAHRHLALRRCVMLALPLHLIEAVLISDHPVVAQHPLPFQPENLLQFPHPRAGQVKVLRGCRRSPQNARYAPHSISPSGNGSHPLAYCMFFNRSFFTSRS